MNDTAAVHAPPPDGRKAPPPGACLYDLGVSFHQTASLAAHAIFLVAAMFSSPPLDATPDDAEITDTIAVLHARFVTAAEPEQEPHPSAAADRNADGREHVPSRCGERNGGWAGDPHAEDASRRYGVAGPSDNPDPHVAREAADSVAWPQSTMLPVIPASWGGDPRAPTMPWGRDDSLGNDAQSARAGIWGDELGAARGAPGMGIGPRRLCPTCGDTGRGVSAWEGRAVETGTESAALLAMSRSR